MPRRPFVLALATTPLSVAAGAGARLWGYVESAAGAAAGRAVERALGASLPEALTRVLVEQAVIERIVDDLLAGETLERVLAIAERREVAIRVTDRALDDGAADRLVEHLLEHPELERILDGALASRFAHSAATRLGESEDVLRVVDAIARSESVRDALQAQSTGLATELADEVRGRTARVDDMLERRARALLRRPPRPAPRVDLPTNGP